MTEQTDAGGVHILMEAGDRVRGERIVCQYRKDRNAILVHLTSGHKGMQRVIEGLPAEAIVDKVWRFKANVA